MSAATAGEAPLRILYLVYWGAVEPLGQSLVVPSVRALARLGTVVTLVTFEKPTDLARPHEMARVASELSAAGIAWHPLRYHKRPKLPATAFDVLRGLIDGARTRGVDLLHARTYVAGLMALAISRLLRVPWIYHNEGFYPDEQVDAGVWKHGSVAHRVAGWLEHRMYSRADGIVALSEASRGRVEDLAAVRQRRTPVIVLPSCLELPRWPDTTQPCAATISDVHLVYLGSVGGRYLLEEMGRFVRALQRRTKNARLTVLSHAPRDLVAGFLAAAGMKEAAWSLRGVPHAEVHRALSGHHAGLDFRRQGLSEAGCSPTKVGEYWAAGLAVVVSPNLGDIPSLIARHRVGVVLKGHTDADYEEAADELRALLAEPDLPERCRRVAEEHYSVENGSQRLRRFYAQVHGRRRN